MTKKIFLYLILLISLLAFSCASKPKLDEELKLVKCLLDLAVGQ